MTTPLEFASLASSREESFFGHVLWESSHGDSSARYGQRSVVIALTHIEQAELLAWSRRQQRCIRVIGNPLIQPLPAVTVQPVQSAAAIYLARVEKRKRPDIFVAAAERSAALYPRERYIMYGPFQDSEAFVRNANLELDTFEYRGTVSPTEIGRTLCLAKVFVLTSAREPWGNVLIMALGLGQPVVITRSSALAPLIQQYGAGIVIPDDDAVALSEAVHLLNTDSKTYEACQRSARRMFAEELDLRVVAAQLSATLTEAAQL
jgi:glycosyltransferase involved in cell wall biosynthesis